MNIIFNIIVVLLPIAWAGRPLTLKLDDLDLREGAPVKCYGRDVALINDDEALAFGYTEERLKDAFAKTMKGNHRPDMLYISPTGKAEGWYDEYSHVCPSPVKRTIRPVKAQIRRIIKNPRVINEHVLRNKGPREVKYKFEMVQANTKKIETSWHSAHEVGVTASVEFGYKAFSAGISLSHTNSWGKEETKISNEIVKVKTETSVKLDKNKAMRIQTNSSNWIVEVFAIYDVRISGCILGTYDSPVNGAYLWFRKPKHLQGFQTKFRTKQLVNFEYYTDIAIRTSTIKLKK
nr:venom protein U-MPTX.8-29 [Megalopyge opercularis]